MTMMGFTFLLTFCLLCLVCSHEPGNFVTYSPHSQCNNNFEITFEIYPGRVVNDYAGVLYIEGSIAVYFEPRTTRLVVSFPTNQGALTLFTTSELPRLRWSSIKIDIHRRSISVSGTGNTYLDDRISVGHNHQEMTSFSSILEDIQAPAHAVLQAIQYSCSNPKEHEHLYQDQSKLYRFDELHECKPPSKNLNLHEIFGVRFTSLNGTSNPYFTVHMKDGPPVGQLLSLEIKLRSKIDVGYTYRIPVQSQLVKKASYSAEQIATFNPKKRAKYEAELLRGPDTTEVELSGYLGKSVKLHPTVYNMRVEVQQEVDPETLAANPGMAPMATLACIRLKNLLILGDEIAPVPVVDVIIPAPTSSPTQAPTLIGVGAMHGNDDTTGASGSSGDTLSNNQLTIAVVSGAVLVIFACFFYEKRNNVFNVSKIIQTQRESINGEGAYYDIETAEEVDDDDDDDIKKDTQQVVIINNMVPATLKPIEVEYAGKVTRGSNNDSDTSGDSDSSEEDEDSEDYDSVRDEVTRKVVTTTTKVVSGGGGEGQEGRNALDEIEAFDDEEDLNAIALYGNGDQGSEEEEDEELSSIDESSNASSSVQSSSVASSSVLDIPEVVPSTGLRSRSPGQRVKGRG